MKRRLFLLFTLIILIISTFNLFAQNTNPTKDIQFYYDEPVMIDSLGTTTIDIKVTVPKDNHIYIDHADDNSYTILTEIKINENSGFKITDTKIPNGEIEGKDIVLRDEGVYKLTIENTKQLKHGEKIPVKLDIISQMCNDVTGLCYRPYKDFDKQITFVINENPNSDNGEGSIEKQGTKTFNKPVFDNSKKNNVKPSVKINFNKKITTDKNGNASFDVSIGVPNNHHIYIGHLGDSYTILTEFELSSGNITITDVKKPKGEVYEKNNLVLRGEGVFTLNVSYNGEKDPPNNINTVLTITTQMCDDITGTCYPPVKYQQDIELVFSDSTNDDVIINEDNADPKTDKDNNTTEGNNDESAGWDVKLMNILKESFYDSPLIAILITFLAGLLTFYLPCTYPLVPLTVSYLGSRDSKNMFESFINSVIYVFGMAVIYGLLGIVAVFAGKAFGSAAFSPQVLIPLLILFIFFMFSMFGYYEIQLPSFMQNFKNKSAKKTKSKFGIFIFGMAAGLVATPCALPVVATILTLIAQASGTTAVTFWNVMYGAFLMFVFALGLGVFFIVLGTFTGLLKKLPKSGKWLLIFQRLFGLLMTVVVVFYLQILLTQFGIDQIKSILLSIGAVSTTLGFILFYDKHGKTNKLFNKIYITISLILFITGVLLQTLSLLTIDISLITGYILSAIFFVIGILLIFFDIRHQLYPKVKDLFKGFAVLLLSLSAVLFLNSLLTETGVVDRLGINSDMDKFLDNDTGLEFLDYEEALERSKSDGKPIFIDFWAVWCTNCLEFEEYLKTDERMQDFFSNFHFVKINYDKNMEFAEKFDVFSLPNFVFVNSDEKVIHREFGFADYESFLNRLKKELSKYIIN